MMASPPAARDPEQNLLLYCARRDFCRELQAKVSGLLTAGIDWNRFVILAAQHQVTPLVHDNLQKIAPELVPTAVSLLFARHCEKYLDHYQEQLKELLRILTMLEDNGVPAIPFKGPTLALDLYGDLMLRPFGDLDILVHPQNVDRCLELLDSMGYHYHSRRSPRKERHFRKLAGQIHLVNDQSDSHVEPHWLLNQYVFALELDYEALWHRARREQLCDQEITLLHPVDEILALCIHGYREQWHKLKWLVDVAEFLHRNQALDWSEVQRASRAIGAARIVRSALLLAQRLLDAPLPGQFLAAPDSATERVVNLASQQILQGNNMGPDLWTLNRFYFYGRERWRDRFLYLCRIHLTPRTALVDAYNLPDTLFFLYYPFNWIHSYLLLPLRNLIRRRGNRRAAA